MNQTIFIVASSWLKRRVLFVQPRTEMIRAGRLVYCLAHDDLLSSSSRLVSQNNDQDLLSILWLFKIQNNDQELLSTRLSPLPETTSSTQVWFLFDSSLLTALSPLHDMMLRHYIGGDLFNFFTPPLTHLPGESRIGDRPTLLPRTCQRKPTVPTLKPSMPPCHSFLSKNPDYRSHFEQT